MDVFTIATRTLVVVSCALLLSGCAAWRTALLNWRLGLDPAAARPAVDTATQQQLDRLYDQGATALLAQDVDAAIAAWRQYVALAPAQLPRARRLRGHLTLLERESARRYARAAAAREKAGAYQPTDRLHVALFPFGNQGPGAGQPGAAAFNRAVMAMVSIDLSRVPTLTVLEREKIDRLVQELQLSASGLVDPASTAVPGRLLGAGTVIAGAVYNAPGPAGPGSGRYRINTAVSDVAAGTVIGTQEADGGQSEFHVLQKRIVYGILETLGIRDLPPGVHRVHTRSWAAYARFAAGLELLAADRYDEARQAFYAALEFDPDFALAEDAFLGTPEQGATIEKVVAELRAAR